MEYENTTKEIKNFLFANAYLTLSDVSFLLTPSEEKIIKISRFPNVPDGEYVSYLSILEEAEAQKSDSQDSFVIKGNIKTNIPVIIRQGALIAGVDILFARLAQNGELEIGIKREGNKSIRGTLVVLKQGTKIAQLGNVKLYTNIDRLTIPISFLDSQTVLNKKDKVSIIFSANTEDAEGLEVRKTFTLK